MPKHIVYSLMATGLWGFWAVFAKLSADRIGHQASALMYSSVSFVTVLLVFLLSGQSLRGAGSVGGGFALLAGILGGLAICSFQRAIHAGSLGTAVSLTALYPVIPVVFGLVFLAERISPTRALGIVLAIAAGILLTV